MLRYLLIGFVFFAILALASFVLFSSMNYKKRLKQDYLLRNHFPYELVEGTTFKDNNIGNFSLIIACLAYATSYIFVLFNRYDSYFILISIIGIISCLIPIALIFTPLSNGKIHLIFVSISFFMVLFNSLCMSIEGFRIFNLSNSPLAIICIILSLLLAITSLFFVLNPKLNKWAKLDEENKEDGTITYKRPKVFPLAYSEWAVIFIDFLNLIPLFFLVISFK